MACVIVLRKHIVNNVDVNQSSDVPQELQSILNHLRRQRASLQVDPVLCFHAYRATQTHAHKKPKKDGGLFRIINTSNPS